MNRTKKARMVELQKKLDEVDAKLISNSKSREQLGEQAEYHLGPPRAALTAQREAIVRELDPLHREEGRDDARLTKLRANFAFGFSLLSFAAVFFKEPLFRWLSW
jgi:hypothetical protein